jgi:hypothetical protein
VQRERDELVTADVEQDRAVLGPCAAMQSSMSVCATVPGVEAAVEARA